jgi:hypothetical protein
MKKELEQQLVQRLPSWFKVTGDPCEARMADGFAHGDGWFNIVWRLCEDLEPLVADVQKATGRPFQVQQIKEKFVGLRVYVDYRTNTIRKRIETAQLESLRTCEVCGKPGKLREGDWMRTACDDHAGL